MDLHELFGELPRQGPGSSASTLRALSLVPELPLDLRIADLGCGTGSHTRVLARATGGHVVAIDRHAPYLDELERQAAAAGVGSQIQVVEGDIGTPGLEAESFDVVWSEGAAYAIGFENALDAWVPLLKPGGYLAVTECSWLRDEPSAETKEFWAEAYPEMRTEAANRELIERRGVTMVGDFPLASEAWWNDFYTPLEQRLDTLEPADDQEARLFEDTRREIEMFRKYDHEYGYVFYVACKGQPPGPEAPTSKLSWFGRLRSRSS